MESEGRRALEGVQILFNDRSEAGFEKSVLQKIRTFWAFHYKAQRFHDALSGTHDDTELIACEDHARGRYTCVDDMVSGYSLEQICGPFGGADQVTKRLSDLVVQLCTVVDTILAAVLEQRANNGARRDITEGTVTIRGGPPSGEDGP